MSIDLGSYNDVASRMREFFEKYPDGRLRPSAPWRVEEIGDKTFVVYEAAAYRDAQDLVPGIGTAWEPFPGRTQFTRDSELMNAETSAWGRAILAVGAADTRKGIASAEEVRNRQADRDEPTPSEAWGVNPAAIRTVIARVGKNKAFLDWIRVTFPTEVERTERVRPAFFTALSQTVTQVGEDVVHTGTGEIVPGLRIRPGGEPGSLSFRISAGAKAVAAEAAGRLIDELAAGLGIEAPDAP